MKKMRYLRLVLFTIFLFGIAASLPAQMEKRNLLELKFNFNYYFKHPRSIYWHTPLIFPDISYKRFFKKKQAFYEFGFDNVLNSYRFIPEYSDIGKPKSRNQYSFENKIGSFLIVTPKLRILVKGGAVFRIGREHIITSIRYLQGTNYILEETLSTYYYKDFGVCASFEFLYQIGNRWYLSLEAGGERFLIRKITTKEQLRAGIGIGYAF